MPWAPFREEALPEITECGESKQLMEQNMPTKIKKKKRVAIAAAARDSAFNMNGGFACTKRFKPARETAFCSGCDPELHI